MYKAAIIGFGNIGYLLSKDKKRKNVWSHFEAYKKIKKTKLIAIVEINKEKRNFIKKKFPKIIIFKSLSKLLNSENKIDIFSICTPTKTHFVILKKLIKQNPKIIICEKPLCANVLEAKKILKITKKSKSLIVVNYQRRFEENFIKVKKIIQKNLIGTINTLNGYYTSKIYNIGTHLIDCIRMIVNSEAISTSSFFVSNKNTADPSISGVINFKNKTICTIQSIGNKYNYVFEIDVIGSKGRVRITDNGKKIKIYKFFKSNSFTNYKELTKIDNLSIFKNYKKKINDPMKELFEEAINSFERKKTVSPNIYDGYQNLLIASSMEKSAKIKKIIQI